MNEKRFFAFEPHGCIKAIGILWGQHSLEHYWCTLERSEMLGAYTHWHPLPEEAKREEA